MSLKDWAKNGWLVEHQASRQEIANLFGIIDRDLAQCRTPDLSPDWQLAIAFNAALQAATAALAAAGYRAARDAHHYRIVQSLAHTIGASSELIAEFDQFRKKRNLSDYDRAGTTSEQEAKEMEKLAQTLRKQVKGWIRKNFRHLR